MWLLAQDQTQYAGRYVMLFSQPKVKSPEVIGV